MIFEVIRFQKRTKPSEIRVETRRTQTRGFPTAMSFEIYKTTKRRDCTTDTKKGANTPNSQSKIRKILYCYFENHD